MENLLQYLRNKGLPHRERVAGYALFCAAAQIDVQELIEEGRKEWPTMVSEELGSASAVPEYPSPLPFARRCLREIENAVTRLNSTEGARELVQEVRRTRAFEKPDTLIEWVARAVELSS